MIESSKFHTMSKSKKILTSSRVDEVKHMSTRGELVELLELLSCKL